METMQFDEKDSLSAMAFVVAGQQKTISGLQDDVKHWRDEYIEASGNFGNERKECIMLRDELRVQTKKYEDCIKTLNARSEQQQAEINAAEDRCHDLRSENGQLSEDIEALKKRLLQWHDADEEFPELKVEDYPVTPACLLLTEIVKDGLWTNDNHPVPISMREILYGYLQLDGGVYKLDFKDSYREVIAWCIVGPENYTGQ